MREPKNNPVSTNTKLLIYSHRCLGFGEPENTMRALRAALASVVDGVEFDVRLTKDKKWVVIHNPFFKNEERTVERVHMKTYNQVKREVTLLDSVLAFISVHGNGKRVMIDVKDVGEEKQIIRMIHTYGLRDTATIIAWEPEVLRRVRERDEKIQIGLSYVPIHSSMKFIKGTVKERISKHKAIMNFNAMHRFDAKFGVGHTSQHYLATIPDLPLASVQVFAAFCSKKLVRNAHERGMNVIPFVVNSRINAALLRRRGVDGILTNHPMTFLHR